MKFFKLALFMSLLSTSLMAHATPDILKKFKDVYGKPNAECMVCHTKPPQRNPYGKAVEGALDKSGSSEATVEVFKSIEALDSDGDGSSNLDEIKADTLPGDSSSKPAISDSKGPIKTEPSSAELIPKHTFHPGLVHFPIALLAMAALFELISKKRDTEFLHKASVLNLSIGLIWAAAAIVTGIVAWQRIGYGLEGNLLIHLILASTSILVGVAAYVQREKPTYFWLILGSGALVMLAGHFGGAVMGL